MTSHKTELKLYEANIKSNRNKIHIIYSHFFLDSGGQSTIS